VAASARASLLEVVDAGIGVKRWLALFLFGITLLALALAIVLIESITRPSCRNLRIILRCNFCRTWDAP